VDPLSLVDPSAELGPGVRIGPFCRVGPGAVLEEDVQLLSHVVVEGRTRIGPRTVVRPFTVLGGPPQHLRYMGEDTSVRIGADCDIREQVSIHRGTAFGGGETVVGDGAMIMACCHVAHDCRLGDGVIMASNATLGGHVEVGDGAFVGGLVGVHQFCRIGPRAFVGGGSAVNSDVIPYGSAKGNRAKLGGLNLVGLKRAGTSRQTINALRAAFNALFLDETGTFSDRVDRVADHFADIAEVMQIVDFIREDGRRPILGAR
jgi:UDP-N-acetylglucosamine acyltransferase